MLSSSMISETGHRMSSKFPRIFFIFYCLFLFIFSVSLSKLFFLPITLQTLCFFCTKTVMSIDVLWRLMFAIVITSINVKCDLIKLSNLFALDSKQWHLPFFILFADKSWTSETTFAQESFTFVLYYCCCCPIILLHSNILIEKSSKRQEKWHFEINTAHKTQKAPFDTIKGYKCY